MDDPKWQAANAAMAEVRSGMRLGLGTGSTARHFVDLVGQAVAGGLDVICVPTSEVTAAQALSLGIPLTDLDATPELDLTVDGADEIGPGLALIKGAGGALLREKIVAAASQRMIVIADASKRVEMLGRFPLSIEVNTFGLGATNALIARVMADFGAEGALKRRFKPDGSPFVTDGGHAIMDAFFGRIPRPEALAQALVDIPGVVEHGLFIGLCKRAYVAGPEGVDVLDG
ncbi:ribose-5-phosphate isomerase RpiA [Devosia sp. ZB163]|uniref:ribose-5-phosphate isomerase RpiA n=1 Tax=Devosia sp. ZB163 TaxID=3025938 RepID=UPI002362C832|nr:ribose-5-phosphate isomerase RpiA [Devosia sp. ZB163]MDC9823897.1 ribose-5-phosphate isomerase RpiA [Devosia sp. ZB163]